MQAQGMGMVLSQAGEGNLWSLPGCCWAWPWLGALAPGVGVLQQGLMAPQAPRLCLCLIQLGGMRLEGQTGCPCPRRLLLAMLMAGQPFCHAGMAEEGGQYAIPVHPFSCPICWERSHIPSPAKAKPPCPSSS